MHPILCFTTGDQGAPGRALTQSRTVNLGHRWDLNLESFGETRVPNESHLCIEEDSKASLRMRRARLLCYH